MNRPTDSQRDSPELQNISPMYAQQPAITSIFERSFAHDQLKPKPFKFGELITGCMSAPNQRRDGATWDAPRSEPLISEPTRAARGGHSPTIHPASIQTRPGMGARVKSTEQLPPLSSLFDTSRPPLTSRSSFGSNPSPTFAPSSPRFSHRLTGHVQQNSIVQPTWNGSHPSQSNSQPSKQFAYSRVPPLTKLSDLPPTNPRSALNYRPDSPGYYESRPDNHDPHRERHVQQPGRWPQRTEQSHQDYFPSMPDDGISSVHGYLRVQMEPFYPSRAAKHDIEKSNSYHESTQCGLSRSQYQNSGNNPAMSESASTKDTLGPKIWTGTHFLPRFVRQAEVPGEGVCYFYDDGTHCKTVIDGEPVNAHWGVTKAGKPRKRLAIACITCREKKIKCDPDYPRCVQCEKFGRICKFKNAPRGGQGSPDSPPIEPDDMTTSSVPQLPDLEESKTDRHGFQFASHHEGKRSPRQEIDEHHPKRRRSALESYTPMKSERNENHFVDTVSPPQQQQSPTVQHQSLDWCAKQAALNPFDTDEALALELLDIYFAHISSTTYCFLPEHRFRQWVTDRTIPKSSDDLVLIYAVLAIATNFSGRDSLRTRGLEFATISRFCNNGREFSLQLVQSRLLLSLYFYATNANHDSWDYCGGALRAAMGLRLNLELDESDSNMRSTAFGLNRYGYAECRRRTFWSCYLMDHFCGFCIGQLSTFNPKDIFLRLPCETRHFEAQANVVAPFFDSSRIPNQGMLENAGVMAYLINMICIWGDVRANNYRGSQTSSAVSSEPFPTFYAKTMMRLDAWSQSLPQRLKFNAENLDATLKDGITGSFVDMHFIFHVTQAKLNRYVKRETASLQQLQSSFRLAHQHSDMILHMSDIVASHASRPFASMYCGYAIVVAIDILTAKGRLKDIPQLRSRLEGSRAILSDLAAFWYSGRKQDETIARRVNTLAMIERDAIFNRLSAANVDSDSNRNTQEFSVNTELGFYEMKISLDTAVRAVDDGIYGVGWDMWTKALDS